MMNIFASLAEFERDLIVERTTAGRKAALAKGKKCGRPKIKRHTKARATASLYKNGMTIDAVSYTHLKGSRLHKATNTYAV